MTKGSGPNSTPPLNGGDGIPETTVNMKQKRTKQCCTTNILFEKKNLGIFYFFVFEYTGRVRLQEKLNEAWMEMFHEIQKLQFLR